MDPLCVSNFTESGKLPILAIQNGQTVKSKIFKPSKAYITDEILTNIQKYKDGTTKVDDGKMSKVWSSPIRREKLKHLIDNPVCICGAGNELTFLYDKPYVDGCITDVIEVNRRDRRGKKSDDKTVMKVPDKLLPSELQLVLHQGTNAVNLIDGKFSTVPDFHLNHVIVLPKMIPNKNHESLKTLQSLSDIFQQSGLMDFTTSNTATVLHSLLSLVKKEQDVYNVVFHNVIKEVTVECIERGELLSNIRQRYRNILMSVPEKVKNFHDGVVAQRILHRRLTEELSRFQNTVFILTSELDNVKQHEESVNQMCHQARDQLKEAMEETKTNADLLREYHGLYEVQRRRMEKSVKQLETEKECWKNVVYNLNGSVLERYSLEAGLTLREQEHNWFKLSKYFVSLLTDADGKMLENIKLKTTQWHSDAHKFTLVLAIRDDNLRNTLEKEIKQIMAFKEDMDNDYFNDKGQLIKPLEKTETENVLNILRSWEDKMSELCEMFGGQSMLIEEDKLSRLKLLCMEFTDMAVEVFNRHRNEVDNSFYPEHSTLLTINEMIGKMMNQFLDQLTGDNGVADGIMTLQNFLENWITRLSKCVTENNYRPFPESEWIRLRLILDDWVELLIESKANIGKIAIPIVTAENKRLEIIEIIQSVENWSQRSISGIESENLKLYESVCNLHHNMVRWTSQIILRIAPDFHTNSPEAKRASRIASLGVKELEEKGILLKDKIENLSKLIISSTKDIVIQEVQLKRDRQYETPDEDNIKLDELKFSTQSWIENSQIVFKEMMEIEYKIQTSALIEKDSKSDLETEGVTPFEEDEINVSDIIGNIIDDSFTNVESLEDDIIKMPKMPPIIEGVSVDSNVHYGALIQDPNKPYFGNTFNNTDSLRSKLNLPQTDDAFKLIKIFEILQSRLKEASTTASNMEIKYNNLELDFIKSKAYLETLEQKFNQLTKDVEEIKTVEKEFPQRPTLFSAENTIERAMSRATEGSTTSKSATSSRSRVRKHTKKATKK